jgi:hypothetical protein
MTMRAIILALKTTFHRDGRVSVNGAVVGEWRSPDPSGAPWARTPVYVFTAGDGKTANHRRRWGLVNAAEGAYRRIVIGAPRPPYLPGA